jgi:hypothetical protein
MPTPNHANDNSFDIERISERWPDELEAAGVASVLFTSDHRVFFMDLDGKIRPASTCEREDVFVQLLSWRDSSPTPACRS